VVSGCEPTKGYSKKRGKKILDRKGKKGYRRSNYDEEKRTSISPDQRRITFGRRKLTALGNQRKFMFSYR